MINRQSEIDVNDIDILGKICTIKTAEIYGCSDLINWLKRLIKIQVSYTDFGNSKKSKMSNRVTYEEATPAIKESF